jgi:itaconyl-CoA hydratase
MIDLVTSLAKVGENRYRTVRGLYFEDFIVGNIVEHRPGRTITDADNVWLSLIGMNQHPIHIDKHYAAKTEFKKILVSSAITFCMINGMISNTMSAYDTREIGWDNVRFVNPVFVGDTIYAESEVIEVKENEEMPSHGTVLLKIRGYNSDKKIVVYCEKKYSVPKKTCNERFE